ncbi:MAG: ATP-binding cassette domain-containing protein, partial [Desulfobacteraceae bacterium]|nr:ATP-binding cassette domain-containing protein [Desulfobacteraceae bacterium]
MKNNLKNAITVRSLSKVYCLYNRPQDRLKQMFLRKRKKLYRDFWALQDISFDVSKGEALGIIGRNGAGKSTLLQILAGTLGPTTGEVSIYGRVACLLELGSGFNLEFTGRENVYMNGSILGFSRSEMDELFEEIASFADIGEFMDQPVKLYSSGMYVRLAFAVQACVEPDVLIVDEALSVGDIFFQQKCHARIEKLLNKKTAVVFVSHNMGPVQKYCRNTILLENGRIEFSGISSESIKRYYSLQRNPDSCFVHSAPDGAGKTKKYPSKLLKENGESGISFWPDYENFIDFSAAVSIGENWAMCTAIALCDEEGQASLVFQQGQRAWFYYEFEALQNLLVPFGVVTITNSKNIVVHGKATYQHLTRSFSHVPKGTRIRFR